MVPSQHRVHEPPDTLGLNEPAQHHDPGILHRRRRRQVPAHIAQRRIRQEHLTSPGQRPHAGATMHLETDDAIVGRRDLANMNTAAHGHRLPTRPRLRGHPPVHVERRGDRQRCGAEQHDGAVALTLQPRDLPSVRCGRRRHDLRDPSQRGDTSLTMSDEQPCRALDVGQQQCDLARPRHLPHANRAASYARPMPWDEPGRPRTSRRGCAAWSSKRSSPLPR